MMHAIRRRRISVLVVLASFLILSAPSTPVLAAASSHAIVYTNGTRAGETWFNRANGTHGNNAWFDVADAKCDASSVYVEYSIDARPRRSFENEGGCGTTKGFNIRSGYFAIVYRTCVNDSILRHPCSQWVSDHN